MKYSCMHPYQTIDYSNLRPSQYFISQSSELHVKEHENIAFLKKNECMKS